MLLTLSDSLDSRLGGPSSRVDGDGSGERESNHQSGGHDKHSHSHNHKHTTHTTNWPTPTTTKTTRRLSDHSIEHHHYHNYRRRHYRHSNRPPVTNMLDNLRTFVVVWATSYTSLLLLIMILIMANSPRLADCLDSPVKIQRNKMMQQQQQQQSAMASPAIGPQAGNVTLAATSAEISELYQNQNIQQDHHRQLGEQTFFDSNSGSPAAPASTNSSSKIDRVRRTNTANEQKPTRRHATTSQPECPSQRLIQGLLPPEYAGSPASSQRPATARAHCECNSDSFGWHLTCFVGSGGTGPPPSAPSAGSGGARLSGISSSGTQSAPPMPNQLHPAFRTSQVARQQQQQQTGGGANSRPRQKRRAPSHWALDESADELLASNSSSSNVDEQLSPHEGFGEDLSAAGGHLHQQAAVAPAPSTRRPSAPFVSPKQNSRANPNRQQQPSVAESLAEKQQDDRLMPAASNVVVAAAAQNHHLTFQTIPILFSVRYLRNNMIEIDCDQAVPNYKAAMFRGFNVNEIHSFTFNDCQLPHIPFSVLLHRTRTNDQSPAAGQQQAAAAPSSSGGRQQQTQSLRPNRRQQQQQTSGGLSRRRRQLDAQSAMMAPRAQRETGESRVQWQQPPLGPGRGASQASGATQEPKVKNLIINLNAIVDQRTLISLLTGLDLLEELQLNYMQLNLTSFLNNLDQLSPQTTTTATTSTTPAMTSRVSSTSTTTTTASPQVVSSSAGTTIAAGEELSIAASANIDKELQPGRNVAAPTTSTLSNLAPVSALPTNPSSTSQQPMSSNKPAAATQTTSTSSSSSSFPTGSGTPSTQASSTTSTTSTTTTTTTTTTPPPATITTQSFQNSLKPFKQRDKHAKPSITTTTSVLSSSSSSSTSSAATAAATTRPSLALMGAPRGLVVAQATGLPPSASSSSAPTTTPLSTVPGVDLRTVHSSVLSSASDPTTTTTTTTTTTRAASSTAGPGQRQATTAANHGNNSNLISVGVSQSHSVSYTANGPHQSGGQQQQQQQVPQTSRPQSLGMFHLGGGSSTQSQPASTTYLSSQPPATVTTSLTSSSQHQQLSPMSRLHNSPSPWFAGASVSTTTTGATSPPAAGSRLSMSSEPSTAPPGSLFSWSAMSTPPAMTQPANSFPGSLGAPANTPPLSTMSNQGQPQIGTTIPQNGGAGNSFGFRTPNGTASSSSSSSSSFRTQTTQQTRRLPVAGTTTTGNNFQEQPTTGGVIAAGGRLSNQPGLNFNTRRFPTTLNQPTATPGGRFVSPLNSANVNPTHTNSHDHLLRAHDGGGVGGDNDFDSAANSPSDESDDLASMDSATTPNLERIPRQKRAAAGSPLEELELSFGDLLPSLRTLKLESFIDLSPLVAPLAASGTGGQQTGNRQPLANSVRQQQTRRLRPSSHSGVGLMRFRRQTGGEFSSADMPERDQEEGSSGSEQNSVVAPGTSGRGAGQLGNDADTPHSHDEMDIEPGETMWRLASERRPSSAAHPDDPGAESDPDDPQEGDDGPLSVVPAPASFAGGVATTPTDSSEPVDPLGPGDSSSSSAVIDRQRQQVSQAILAKLFSRLNKLQVLQLTSNEIPFWPDAVLQDSRSSLLRLYLISNNIRQMGSRAFAGLGELRTLDLSSNQLRQLPGDLFRDLIQLRQARACRNLFRKLPLKLLMKQPSESSQSSSLGQMALTKLESVDFSKNRYLSQFYLEQQVAGGGGPLNLAPIASLNLSDCSLTDQLLVVETGTGNINQQSGGGGGTSNFSVINQLLFASLPELTSVSLQNNKFRDLLNVPSLFGKNKQLTRIDLSRNQLSRINGHLFNANASQLVELKLSHNKLAKLPEQLLFNLRKLRHLSLAHNKLIELNSKLFLTNQLLESLDLSHNQLVSLNTHASGQIPFGNGANLRHLNLAHNNLSAFETDLFDIAWSFYVQLHSLDLSHNHFAGQIQMPIFYTISDEMLLNLASNRIQSVSVDALVQHEQVLDKYATSFETILTSSANADSASPPDGHSLTSGEGDAISDHHLLSKHRKPKRSASYPGGSRVPTVTIRLANNPLACDCMLEPLVSYTRRVAAATNPALVASLFQQQQQQQQQHGSATTTPPSGSHHEAGGLAPGSKYSFSTAGGQQDPARQPQVLYQFKFNDLHCDRPRNLQKRLLNHISIGDLLCPVQDERLCPRQCECHYQSAFKTIIVDCSGRQLMQVPEQLTDSANFNQFELETSFNLSSSSQGNNNNNNRMTISHVDKMIIRLDNNRLTSFEPLVHLFQVMSIQPTGDQQVGSVAAHERFVRSPLWSETPAESAKAKKVSPVTMARLQHQQVSEQQQQQQRQTRQASAVVGQPASATSDAADAPTPGADGNYLDLSGPTDGDNLLSGQPEAEMVHNLGDPGTGTGAGGSITHMSTAVLESAEEFRNKRYSQKTCELYLDHNSIDTLPETFLSALDQVRASSLQASLVPPQAALPTAMLEPPIHSKVTNLNAAGPGGGGGGGDPMKASASVEDSLVTPSSLFGRQPLAAEKKAALMETVQHNVRMSKMQLLHDTDNDNNKQVKMTLSPSLVVLSLRYNNLGNINARMLARLSKLIRASNTKLFFGHNPFNCSDNFEPTPLDGAANSTLSSNNMSSSSSSSSRHDGEENNYNKFSPASPMGDQLLAVSDSVSGAYLEHSPDDLLPAASGDPSELNSLDSTQQANRLSSSSDDASGQLQPSNCPVGQLKTWLTRHHAHVGDLDELYCVHMPAELAERLKLTGGNTTDTTSGSGGGGERLKARHVSNLLAPTGSGKREHDHPWTSSLVSPTLAGSSGTGSAGFQATNTSQVSKNGLTWNADLLMQSARLIDVDLYDMCPYSNIQLLDAASVGYLSAGHQQALISVAVLFILLSLCLLLMLIYFGDTQTILAFIYIHLNPIYNCLHLNESHLDGEKLYDAFVSYSSADRDIVMQLIEHLEQPGAGQFDGQKLLADGKGTNLDKSRDTLVTEADLRPDLLPVAGAATIANNNNNNNNGTLQRRTNSALSVNGLGSVNASYQDLSTMSRSTSRMMLSEDTNGHQMELMSPRNERNNNNNLNGYGSTGKNHSAQAAAAAPPYRLCIHERDWLPGHLISWNIVNSVQNSRRTILILSKEFIKSVWFQVEFHTAYYQMLEDKIDRLIVIVRGELPPKHELDKNLAFLLTTKTYLTWGEKWFWERLHYALPHRAGVPPAVRNKPPTVKINKPVAPVKRQDYNNQQQQATTLGQQVGKFANGSAVSLLGSLAAGHADPARPRHQQQQQQQLVMSNIGKGCSNLLLAGGGGGGNSTTINGKHESASSSSSSSSGSSTNNGGPNQQAQTGGGARSTSASSFLSGSSSSTNQLFRPNDFAQGDHQQMMTTSNDLLSSPMAIDSQQPARGMTRLSINGGMRSSSPLATDSGRITADRSSSSQMSTGGSVANNTTSGGITSIMLGEGGVGGGSGANSRLRAKKQEKLQTFVEKEISNHFNLSEL